MSWQGQIAVTALISSLIELVIHYFPWQLAFKKEIPHLFAYICGSAGFLLPMTGLLHLWSRQWGIYPVPGMENMPDGVTVLYVLLALWIVMLSAGGAVCMAKAVDFILRRVRLADELVELMEANDKRKIDKASNAPTG